MIVHTLPAAAFGTNCYVLAPAEGLECVIVDPGIGVADRVHALMKAQGLTPAAILLTHGHLDHVYDVPSVNGSGAQPLTAEALASHIHHDDRYRLADPAGDLDPTLVAMLEAELGTRAPWREPEVVVEFTGDRAHLEVAGLNIEVTHAPGHTQGSVLFALDHVPSQGFDRQVHEETAPLTRTVLSGDVLFAGSIGRTDLPGGDPGAMARTLREVVLALSDNTLVLPGHGPCTTMGRERTSNPHLAGGLV